MPAFMASTCPTAGVLAKDYIYIHVWLRCIRTYTSKAYTYTDTCSCTCMYTYTAYMCKYIYVICTSIDTYLIYTYIYIHICMYTCIYVYICIFMYIDRNSYVHRFKHRPKAAGDPLAARRAQSPALSPGGHGPRHTCTYIHIILVYIYTYGMYT